MQTGCEAERGPEEADEDVAQADVEQDEVDGRPQGAKLCEDEQDEEVAEDSRHQNEAEAYRHHRVAGPAQPAEDLRRRGVRQGGRVGAEAGGGGGGGGGERAVCGAEIAAACVEDHSSESGAQRDGEAVDTQARNGKRRAPVQLQQLRTL